MPQDHSGFVSSLLSDVSGNQKTNWGTAGKTNFYSPSFFLPSLYSRLFFGGGKKRKGGKGEEKKKKGEGPSSTFFVCAFVPPLPFFAVCKGR